MPMGLFAHAEISKMYSEMEKTNKCFDGLASMWGHFHVLPTWAPNYSSSFFFNLFLLLLNPTRIGIRYITPASLTKEQEAEITKVFYEAPFGGNYQTSALASVNNQNAVKTAGRGMSKQACKQHETAQLVFAILETIHSLRITHHFHQTADPGLDFGPNSLFLKT